MHLSAANGDDIVVASLLVEVGAEVTTTSRDGNTTLHAACARWAPKLVMVRFLLDSGAAVNATNGQANTALHCALDSIDPDCEIVLVSTLLNENVEADVLDRKGHGPLQTAIIASQVRNALVLIEAGANVKHTDLHERTPLHWAALYRLSELVEPLLSKGAELDARDSNGETPLHLAVKQNWMDIVELLIGKGASPDICDVNGSTALHKASTNGLTEIIGLLIDKGADPSIADKHQHTAIDMARNKRTSTLLTKRTGATSSATELSQARGFNVPELDQTYFVFLSDSPLHRSLGKACEPDCVYGVKLTNKRLTEIPEEILEFINLNVLILNRNRIREFPISFTTFANLNLIDMSDNELRSLPAELGNLDGLSELYLQNNPISLRERGRIRNLVPSCKVVF